MSSEATDVMVCVDADNQLTLEGLSETCVCALSTVKISPRLGNTMRKLTLPDGATCESLDHAALDALMSQNGRGKGAKLVHRLESNWRTAILATVVLIGTLALGVRVGIPIMSQHVAAAIPASMAYDLGEGSLQLLDATMLKPSRLQAERQRELRNGFLVIAQAYPALPLSLQFRQASMPNAFALPDGTVIVTDDLVALIRDDQELYSVLVHEIGHVHHRHALRMALESSTIALFLSAYFGDVTHLSALSSSLPAVIAQSHYSREHEVEADTFALEYLDRAHIPRKHYANVLRALQKMVGSDPKGGMQFLASHPPTAERIRRFEQ
jgi:Zn-dependent protease with chaperone function